MNNTKSIAKQIREQVKLHGHNARVMSMANGIESDIYRAINDVHGLNWMSRDKWTEGRARYVRMRRFIADAQWEQEIIRENYQSQFPLPTPVAIIAYYTERYAIRHCQ